MKTNQLTKLIAIGTIATGVAAVFSATPARAATFNGGQLDFAGLTSDFYTQLTTTAVGNNFNINFNPLGNTAILSNDLTVPSGTNTASSLTPSTFQPISSAVGTFTKNSASAFTLFNPLSFAFGSGTSVNIASGNLFSLNFLTPGAVNFGFTGGNGIGTISNGTDSTTAQVLSFTISDGATLGGGNYGIIAGPVNPTAVPEPFTVIGTIIGGATALRMRKKLSDVNKN